jgi:hypothetical protein
MKAKYRQSGISLTEIAVVIATIALLVAVGVPAVRAFINSFETGSSTKSMISAALSNARAIAAKEQKYAGVRFQKICLSRDLTKPLDGLLEAPQYMTFIIQDPNLTGTYGYGFRAIKGLKPIRLPDTVGVMDLTIVTSRNEINPVNPQEIRIDDPVLGGDGYINEPRELTDTTTFSIVFAPSGKLVIHGVRIRNKDSKTDASSPPSNDDVFNTLAKITDPTNPAGMFLQDDYFEGSLNLGLGPEPSRNSFIIYEQKEFKRAYESGQAWSGYLKGLEPFYINAYMGTIIE